MIKKFVKIAALVKAAQIPAVSSSTILWCIEQLPALYESFAQTYETRFSDKIAHLEQGMLAELREAKNCPETTKLTALISSRLRSLHALHGLQSLDPKPTPVKLRVRMV